MLYWLGDESEGHQATWDFLDRRIEGVMRFEKTKAQLRDNPVLSKLLAGPFDLIGRVRAPEGQAGLPGHMKEDPTT